MSPIAKPAARAVAKPAARPAAVARPAARAAAPAKAAVPANGFNPFNPDTFTSGGLLDDVDVTVTDALCVEYDYNGNAPLGPAVAIEYTDANGAEHIQYYSAGKAEDWRQSEDGLTLVPVSGKAGINNQTNLGKYLESLIAAGFPKDMIQPNIKFLVGLECHVQQVEQERKGLIRTGPNANRPSTVLLVTKINQLPNGEAVEAGQSEPVEAVAAAPVARAVTAPASKAAAGGKANGAAKTGMKAPVPAQAEAQAPASDLDTFLTESLSAALAESESGEIPKKDIPKVVFKACNDAQWGAKERNQAVVRSGQQEFLTGLLEAGVEYDGSAIRLQIA